MIYGCKDSQLSKEDEYIIVYGDEDFVYDNVFYMNVWLVEVDYEIKIEYVQWYCDVVQLFEVVCFLNFVFDNEEKYFRNNLESIIYIFCFGYI